MLRTAIITLATAALLTLIGRWGLGRALDQARPLAPAISFERLRILRGGVELGALRLHHPRLAAEARRVILTWSDGLRPAVRVESAHARVGPVRARLDHLDAQPTPAGWALTGVGVIAEHPVDLRGAIDVDARSLRVREAAGLLFRGRLKGADVQFAALEATPRSLRLIEIDAWRGPAWWGGGVVEIEQLACGAQVTLIGGQAWYALAEPGEAVEAPAAPARPLALGCPIRVADLSLQIATPLGPRSLTIEEGDLRAGSVALRAHGPEGRGEAVIATDRHWLAARGQVDLAQVPHINGVGAARGQIALVRHHDTTRAHARGRLDGHLHHPAIAEAPVDVSGLIIDAHATLQGEALTVHVSRLERAGVRASATAAFTATTVDLRAQLAETDCQALWGAIPSALRGPYAKARLSGRVSPRLRLRMPRGDAMKLRLDWTGPSDCQVDALNTDPDHLPPVKVSGARDDVDWLLRDFRLPVRYATRPVEVGPGTPAYVPIAQLPRWVGAAAIVSEDNSFNRGKALNLGLLRRALMFNLDRGRYVYGGSTIPQQLAKNLFLTRRKTLARKLQEAIVALRMVQVVPTRRILELYLNCIEFAPNVYGVERAARHYFQKGARRLTPKEAAFLGISKPSPRYAASMRRRGSTPDTPHFREYMRRIIERMRARGAISDAQAAAARPFQIRWRGGRKISRSENQPQNEHL